jgi:dethiobiotin synthase
MVTLLISGSGTDIGKTHVVGALARVAARRGRSVQIVKPVQTGAEPGQPSDAEQAAELAAASGVQVHTLRRYPEPLTPLAAVDAAMARLDIVLVRETLNLPPVDVRLIEGAGGLAVPLGPDGSDWTNYARAVHTDGVVLVVPDQLGAISQCRTYFFYLSAKLGEPLYGGVFLNELDPTPSKIKGSIRAALAADGIPLWGELGLHAPLGQFLGA